ncbi:hypothetical protein CEUSTIGMA_g7089.t1 [Chlamydomonas eustigma]|uniref:Protein SYS1 homolog n=1 Tax=Chlamydomonas eustigma TaxID=1157962 RepID=A0A250X9A2_9CHLO|nr:hypothetical protein CEUSTIGMA_g7089.t1 [Chlamydomonas eustigma]|eukprot:GAX79648.1 hypothetical protein CEUSTIGMA_g7089.t1 [Chlamydomonas eustigma]
MATKQDQESRTILKKLSIFLVLFYSIYYILSIVLVGGFHVNWQQLGRFPFRINQFEFNPAAGGDALGAWLAMVLTFTCSLALTYLVVKATRKAWDYVVTTSLFHFVICCIVNQAFPVNWIWWLTLILCNVILSLAAEITNYYLVDMRDIQLDH